MERVARSAGPITNVKLCEQVRCVQLQGGGVEYEVGAVLAEHLPALWIKPRCSSLMRRLGVGLPVRMEMAQRSDGDPPVLIGSAMREQSFARMAAGTFGIGHPDRRCLELDDKALAVSYSQ